jgi:hypothetical protein
MRLTVSVLALLALAACQPSTSPASESAAAPETSASTPEELGQDDPSVPFAPAAVEPPHTYEATSKTAMSFTPGVLTVTPTPQLGPNHAGGAVFAFGNGYTLETTFEPGAATQGERPFDFTNFIIDAGGAPIDPSQIRMYGVDEETLPSGSANGGFCEKTSFIATYLARSPGAEDLTIVAFSGDQWPPKDETALCGTFLYSNVH